MLEDKELEQIITLCSDLIKETTKVTELRLGQTLASSIESMIKPLSESKIELLERNIVELKDKLKEMLHSYNELSVENKKVVDQYNQLILFTQMSYFGRKLLKKYHANNKKESITNDKDTKS